MVRVLFKLVDLLTSSRPFVYEVTFSFDRVYDKLLTVSAFLKIVVLLGMQHSPFSFVYNHYRTSRSDFFAPEA